MSEWNKLLQVLNQTCNTQTGATSTVKTVQRTFVLIHIKSRFGKHAYAGRRLTPLTLNLRLLSAIPEFFMFN
jgi:hypothetical protein